MRRVNANQDREEIPGAAVQAAATDGSKIDGIDLDEGGFRTAFFIAGAERNPPRFRLLSTMPSGKISDIAGEQLKPPTRKAIACAAVLTEYLKFNGYTN